MVARRNSKGSAHLPAKRQQQPPPAPGAAWSDSIEPRAGRLGKEQPIPPPAPGAEWGDEEEFERFWGKSLDQMVAEFEREDADASPRRVLTEAEFLASLEGRPQGVPTYEETEDFWRDYLRLSPAQRRAFRVAIRRFVEDLRRGPFRKGLRVKSQQRIPGVWEMTWAPDGRALFEYGPETRPGEKHIICRRIGGHDILD